MERTLEEHKVNPANDTLTISVMDEPGSGGANHEYVVSGGRMEPIEISFQNGPIAESGVNGITQEVLLAIVADRLRGFQSGKFACKANAHLIAAAPDLLEALQELVAEAVEVWEYAEDYAHIERARAALSKATGLPQP